MTCRKIRHLMPLAAGGDLGPRRARAFRTHVDACPGCREELEAYRATLRALRTAAKGEGVPDWTEGEWKALMVRATAAEGENGRRTAAGRPALWPRWAAASAAGILVGLVVLGVLFRGPIPGPAGRVAAGGRTGEAAAEAGGQDVVTLTMVSQETGLQIVWFFDKDFDYKGENE
jgi:anti-sigma factor RsiW